jgi:copper homeostasis protein
VKRLPLEICISGASMADLRHNARAAAAGLAERVELCSAMGHGGLSPSAWQLRTARAILGRGVELVVMVRPRAGGFHCPPTLLGRMLREIEQAAMLGADGVALGVLKQGALDLPALRRLSEEAHGRGLKVTFHRAFDAVSDRREALETLISQGVARVLTSGTAWGGGEGAWEGRCELAHLIHQAGARIEIVVAGNLRPALLPVLLRQLPIQSGRVSLHAWSGALLHGRTHRAAVRQFAQAARC